MTALARPLAERLFHCAWTTFDVSEGELIGDTREMRVAMARWAVMHALRCAGYSYPRIGRKLHRDHSTIIHGVRRCQEEMASDAAYRRKVRAMLALARAHELARSYHGAANHVRDHHRRAGKLGLAA